MILEEQRFLHEDLERLENGIADRVAEEPRLVRTPFTSGYIQLKLNPVNRLEID